MICDNASALIVIVDQAVLWKATRPAPFQYELWKNTATNDKKAEIEKSTVASSAVPFTPIVQI